jgi:translation elongation factor EF-Tu-like GTPase
MAVDSNGTTRPRTRLFAVADAFSIKGRGTVIVGTKQREVEVRKGDVIEVWAGERAIGRRTVRAVEWANSDPPPPVGVDVVGILIDQDLGGERGPFEVWVVA